jgi:hypothetical protein
MESFGRAKEIAMSYEAEHEPLTGEEYGDLLKSLLADAGVSVATNFTVEMGKRQIYP